MNYELLGRNIARMRNINRITQEQLAEKADVSSVFISQIETGVRKPSLETLYKISDTLNTTIDSLLGNASLQTKYNEIAYLIGGKTDAEIKFITNIVREICAGTDGGKIISE